MDNGDRGDDDLSTTNDGSESEQTGVAPASSMALGAVSIALPTPDLNGPTSGSDEDPAALAGATGGLETTSPAASDGLIDANADLAGLFDEADGQLGEDALTDSLAKASLEALAPVNRSSAGGDGAIDEVSVGPIGSPAAVVAVSNVARAAARNTVSATDSSEAVATADSVTAPGGDSDLGVADADREITDGPPDGTDPPAADVSTAGPGSEDPGEGHPDHSDGGESGQSVDSADITTPAVSPTADGSGADLASVAPSLDRSWVQAAESANAAAEVASPTSDSAGEADAALWHDLQQALGRARAGVDGQEVRIRLRPAELGDLLVRVQAQGEHLSVSLVASSPAAHQALLADRDRLSNELAAAGFSGGSVDVSQEGDGGRQQQDAQADGSPTDRSRNAAASALAGPQPVGRYRSPAGTTGRVARHQSGAINVTL